MMIPNELHQLFDRYLQETFGMQEVTSDREKELGRHRYFNEEFLVITLSYENREVFTVNVVPEEYKDGIVKNWEIYLRSLKAMQEPWVKDFKQFMGEVERQLGEEDGNNSRSV